MKLAVVVQGRFHAFDLVRALIKRGVDVTVFSNYPRWAVARFGIPPEHVRSFPISGILWRVAGWLRGKTGISFDALLHPMFGRWARSQLRRGSWDAIHAWSGVSEEIDADPALDGSLKLVMRGSAHILTQSEILREEQRRSGCALDQPSQWMIDREQREYRVADVVVVLSTFAFNSFRDQGVPESRLRLLPLGTDTSAFRPGPEVIDARRARILSGKPLRVLYVGNVSFQKGLTDLRETIERTSSEFQFRMIGSVTEEARAAVAALGNRAEFAGKKPQSELSKEYAWADVFIFPTLQDGYAVVLAQACAAGLPVLTTSNCCGPDLVREGRTGWVLPIRNAQAFIDRLRWCDASREELAGMVSEAYAAFRTRDWSDVAADFEALCTKEIAAKRELMSAKNNGSLVGV